MHRELEPDEEKDTGAAEPVGEQEESEREGEEDRERARALLRFERVATSMEQILAPNPALCIEGEISQRDERGLEELYTAARGVEDGRRVSGIARLQKLNRALAALRSALVAGLDPALPEQRKHYESLGDQVGDLRHRITQRIYVEAVGFGGGDFEEGDADEEREEEEAISDEDLVPLAEALEFLTDELAFSAGKRRRRGSLGGLVDAARALSTCGDERAARASAQSALEEALGELLADPDAAAEGAMLREPGEVPAEIAAVRQSLGDAPRGREAADAAARILGATARASRKGAH